MTVPVVRKGSDSAARADPHTMAMLGLSFAMRYVGLGSNKLLTAAEVQVLHDAGIDILGNPELDTSDGSGGFAQGVRYATVANDHYDAIGAPQTAVLVYSIDTNRTADWVRPYFQGIASVKRRPAGGYGGTEMVTMLDEGLIAVWVQANAGSWSGYQTSDFPTHPRAHFRQHLPVTLDGFNFDPEDQIAPTAQCGFWLSPKSINPPAFPVAQEDSTVAHTYNPTRQRWDEVVVGSDHRLYQRVAPTFAALSAGSNGVIGDDTVTAKRIGGLVWADADTLTLSVHGMDDLPYHLTMTVAAGWGLPVAVQHSALLGDPAQGSSGAQGVSGADLESVVKAVAIRFKSALDAV